MKQKSTIIIAISLTTIIIILLCSYNLAGPILITWAAFTAGPFMDKSSEELFYQYVLDGDFESPSQVSVIDGLERAPFFAPGVGPVYIRFKTDTGFVNTLLERKSESYGLYTEISCDSFFEAVQSYSDIKNHPERFQWWNPKRSASPNCYRSERKLPFYDDEAKYLLVDRKNSEVYFFRTITPPVAGY